MNVLTDLEIKKMRQELNDRTYSHRIKTPRGREYWSVDRIVQTLEFFHGILRAKEEAQAPPQSIISKEIKEDWTVKDGLANSSDYYIGCVNEVTRLIRESSNDLIGGQANKVARLIVSQLAHKHGLTAPETIT